MNNDNFMILNDVNLGIKKIELDKSSLKVYAKNGIYCLRVFIYYNWPDINNLKIGAKEKIDFNEYILEENNEPALILPTNNYVEKLTDTSLCFYFKFENMSNTIEYMNKKNGFNIIPNTLEVKVLIDYKNAMNGSIIYEFDN